MCTETGCDCHQGYRGMGCEIVVCPNNCTNNGICVHGECNCDHGWEGAGCAVPICSTNCTGGHGICIGFDICACHPTWEGKMCELSICGDGCDLEFGICQADRTCQCRAGFGGQDCSCKTHDNLHSDAKVCSGHGVCGQRKCYCDTMHMWGGIECQEKLCPNECSSHGECSLNGTCTCQEGWSGEDCSLTDCPDQCSGHGVCMVQSGGGGGGGSSSSGIDSEQLDKSCVCFGGWGGPEANCAELTCDYNCHNRGLCSNGTCFCHAPFTGDYCEVSTCNPECGEHGRCLSGTCECEKNWWGETCEREECVHGMWRDDNGGGCSCQLGWGGAWCNTTSLCLPGTCANGGYCQKSARSVGSAGFNCVCPQEFTGRFLFFLLFFLFFFWITFWFHIYLCNLVVFFFLSFSFFSPPLHHIQTGATCEQIVCPNPCSGHGTCNSDMFQCDCEIEYDGLLCGQKTNFRTAQDVMKDLDSGGKGGGGGLRGVGTTD